MTTRIIQSSNVARLAALSHARLGAVFRDRNSRCVRALGGFQKKFQHIVVSKT
jgi:hypothetical protein